ncbi:alcohol dehydrogenase [Burkholderia savannae]|uniref:zinc-dependent alcohol dehydrogenase family protein n=1 Tax=Burkholderia savannae TaxID=1637837 RepID=UPI0007579401|nr:NAD(P)-dependent alcohol dehydrogenase [Burkholderia savannae]AOJ81837.1 alcohol dehydrogenase [Burkholderia savannae]
MAQTMKVWELDAFGIDRLALAQRPVPKPGDGELLVRVAAVSLNYRDKLVIEGQLMSTKPAMPFTPVSDMCGEVVETGPNTERFKRGDRVMGNFWTPWISGALPPEMRRCERSLGGPLPGVLAEYVVLPESAAVCAPASLSDVEASTLPVAGVTAWVALVERGQLAAGQTVVVQGTGGVALFGLQIARALGAKTIVLSRHDDKLVRAKSLGAWAGINTTRAPEWEHAVLELTGGRGANVIVELIGGENVTHSVAAVADHGHIVQVGFLGSPKMLIDAIPLMLTRASIHGVSVGSRQAFEAFVRAADRHAIKPTIDFVYPFSDVRAAFAHLDRGPFGKIVVAVRG